MIFNKPMAKLNIYCLYLFEWGLDSKISLCSISESLKRPPLKQSVLRRGLRSAISGHRKRKRNPNKIESRELSFCRIFLSSLEDKKHQDRYNTKRVVNPEALA